MLLVTQGSQFDYIDFDTKDKTYDALVPHAFEIMEVLFNYKRTIEDLKKCGEKARVRYNFPFVSDCVGSAEFEGPCKGSQYPVPCGDGNCHSNYISCLRSMVKHSSIKESTREIAQTRLRLAARTRERLGPQSSSTSELLNTIYKDAQDSFPSSQQSVNTLKKNLQELSSQRSPVQEQSNNEEKAQYSHLVFSGELKH